RLPGPAPGCLAPKVAGAPGATPGPDVFRRYAPPLPSQKTLSGSPSPLMSRNSASDSVAPPLIVTAPPNEPSLVGSTGLKPIYAWTSPEFVVEPPSALISTGVRTFCCRLSPAPVFQLTTGVLNPL